MEQTARLRSVRKFFLSRIFQFRQILSSGEAVLSGNTSKLLVNNLNTGQFDLYDFPDDSPSKSFLVPSHRRKIIQVAFAEEKDNVAICGSDNGKVYIFCVDSGNRLQVLEQETGD